MKTNNYDHKKIESKWQKEWDKKKIYQASNTSKKKKFYSLIEFPYPSGAGLHVGHPRPHIGMDVISRKRRMKGYNVLYPIGWDAFGLPTENYAIKTGIPPAKVTKQNTDTFRRQIKMLGTSFDWSREINTTDPAYYKWTQWIFLQMFKKGLAYKKKSVINWCPSCKIGLANEEVVDGKCERCGGDTIKKEKEQWMLAITKYADRLDRDLDTVNYLERIKLGQRNWIGRSEGSFISFALQPINTNKKLIKTDNQSKSEINQGKSVEIFTTRADTLFGATYVVLAPEHELVGKLKIENKKEVEDYIKKVKSETDIERTSETKEKTGVELKGIKAINPANGEEIPVWIADYVLASYGTGAVMAVPAHDERDFEFAKKYDLPIRLSVEPFFKNTQGSDAVKLDLPFVERHAVVAIIKHWSENKYLCSFWKKNDWRGFIIGGVENNEKVSNAAIREVVEETGYKNVEYIKSLGYMHSQFYHQIKNVNRFAHFEVVLLKLKNEEQEEISAEENAIHDVVWLSPEEVGKQVNREDIQYAWSLLSEEKAFTDDGILVNSGEFNDLTSEEARKKITEFVGGKMVTKFKLRDWIFSRQRYWGEPIPIVHCEKCGYVPISEKELPLILPKVKSYQPTDNGESPLATISKWVNTKCPKCKGKAKRETDTMPNWAGSSWYYLRYTDPTNKKEFASAKALKYWTPVDWYNGGMEHTTLHLLYSRFWHKFLYDLKLVPTKEPYKKRTAHGMILAEDGEKMSKSRGNVVNPDEIIKLYGADTLRVYEMFIGPFDQTVVWSTKSIIGSRRFLEKVWRIGQKIATQNYQNFSRFTPEGPYTDKNFDNSVSLQTLLHKTIKKVSEDIESMSFNTAISSMMMLVNEMEGQVVSKEDFKMFLKILSPFAPHITEELWQQLRINNEELKIKNSTPNSKNQKANTKHQTPNTSIHLSEWPKWDKKKIIEEEVKIAVQVNGKVRAEIMVSKDMTEENIKKIALENKSILTWILNKEIKKFIYVPGRIINIVI
jgi:leucyl-tRNA synthetase